MGFVRREMDSVGWPESCHARRDGDIEGAGWWWMERNERLKRVVCDVFGGIIKSAPADVSTTRMMGVGCSILGSI